MSFIKKLWKNRDSQYPARRTLTRVDTQASVDYDITRAEGTVTEEGDDFSAENMNDLENRIYNAIEDAGGGNFVGVRYHASLTQYPDYPCWEDLTAEQKAKYDVSTGATVNFLDEDDGDSIIGTTDISDIADGTLTGAVGEHEDEITTLKSSLERVGANSDSSHIYFTGVDTTGKSFDKSKYRFIGIRAIYNNQDMDWKLIPAAYAFASDLYSAYSDGSTSMSAKLTYSNDVIKCVIFNGYSSIHIYGFM